MQNRAESYFDRFGKPWAFASFSQMIEDKELGALLSKGQEDEKKQKLLRWFFKTAEKNGQHLGKISWISDVISSDNFARVESTLAEVAREESVDVWNKKTELALAKLASLAVGKEPNYDNDLALIAIQEALHDHVAVAIGDAVDEKAAQDLAYDIFASRIVAKLPALKRQLKTALKSLVRQAPMSAYELIDLLTLMDPSEWAGSSDDDPGILGNEFAYALRVVDISDLAGPDDLRALIWRRAMIRDDWEALNKTGGKDDQSVESEMQLSSLYKTIGQILMEELDGGETVHLLSPSEILAREAFPASLRDRFVESEHEGLRKDLEREQAKLKTFVEKARLEDHYGGLVTSAQRSVREASDRQGEDMAEKVLNLDG
jgi:nuclear pore complex protein Nup133